MKSKLLSSVVLICLFIFVFSNLFGYNNDITIISKKRAYLGVHLQDLTPKLAKKMDLNIKEGAVVTKVEKDSPADSAGIKENDVIVEVDGRQIYDADDLIKTIGRTKPGDKINVVVNRKGEKKSINVLVGKYPRSHFFSPSIGISIPQISYFHTSGKLGLELMDLNEQLGEYFGTPNNKGVLIKKVNEKSAAEKAGFKAGDVIIKVGKEDIKKINDIWESLEDFDEGDKVEIEVLRKGVSKKLTVELEEGFGGSGFNYYYNYEPHCLDLYLDDLKGDIRLNLDEFKVNMEKLKPELEELGKNIKIEIGKSMKELKRIKPELEKMKEQLKIDVKKCVRSVISI